MSMLSRTAGNLYWLGRYMERAENLARILEVGYRMSQMPAAEAKSGNNEWQSSAVAAACDQGLLEKHGEANLNAVMDYVALDEDNPSSIHCCLHNARNNARSVRTALTGEMWESLNDMWLEFTSHWAHSLKHDSLLGFLDWVKSRSTQFRGAIYNTMLRDEAHSFINLGTYLERADNTARILDVKFHILLPRGEVVGGSVDYTQWSTVLRSVSALGAYHYIYRDVIQPWKVAELLILRQELPRSLIHAHHKIDRYLQEIARRHGRRYDCQRLAGKLYSELGYANIEEIYQEGLHQYLAGFLERNNALGATVAENFHFNQ
jgi:uncharacterized alpha-E superfamily protein